ncbi:MAG TPA: hypothetical protein VF339_18665 [Gammaproteobacteria bacterium]
MANSTIPGSSEPSRERLEGIQAQAVRVVHAYHQLRARTRGEAANPANDNFPVGALAQLLSECSALATSLEPILLRPDDEPATEPSDRDRREGANDTPDDDDEPGDGAKPRYALLREPERDYGVADLVFAVGAIGKALDNHEDDVDVVEGLAGALRIIGAELATASMNVCLRHQQAVKRALDAIGERS